MTPRSPSSLMRTAQHDRLNPLPVITAWARQVFGPSRSSDSRDRLSRRARVRELSTSSIGLPKYVAEGSKILLVTWHRTVDTEASRKWG